MAVANKVKSDEDENAIREFCSHIDLPVEAVIPYDPVLFFADQKGPLKLEEVTNSPALKAIVELASQLTASVKVE
ncbi:MAG: hypothetical protein M3413_05460 [Bacteroidota bacterium]|nr:hypothetical protein [Bacteroidota bacterium]